MNNLVKRLFVSQNNLVFVPLVVELNCQVISLQESEMVGDKKWKHEDCRQHKSPPCYPATSQNPTRTKVKQN